MAIAAVIALALLAALACSHGAAAAASPAPPDSDCRSLMQCYIVRLGAPKSDGEWLMAYLAASHEHCRDLLVKGGPDLCERSVRCTYAAPPGSGGGRSSGGVDAYRLLSSGSHQGLAGADAAPGPAAAGPAAASAANASSSSANFWQRAAGVLGLQQPACLPDIFTMFDMRTAACAQRTTALHASGAARTQKAGDPLVRTCLGAPATCFMANTTDAGAVAAWWAGPAAAALLEANSSWLEPGRLQAAADACSQAWGSGGQLTRALCATRGIGRGGNNGSIALSRLVVALMDAFESSACNNTVTFSEALAVERIAEDMSCRSGRCQASGAAGRGARLLGQPLLLLLLTAAAALALGLGGGA